MSCSRGTTMFSKTLLLFLVMDVVWSKEANSYGQMMNDYSYIDAEKSFYKIHLSAQTWSNANRLCAQEGATFWHPDNDNEAHAVVSFWKNTLPNIGVIYVGMSDIMAEGQFETVEGKLVSDVYNKWEPGQPNNYGGTQDCVRLYSSGIILDDCSCDFMYNFICKKSLQSLGWNFQCNVSDSDGQMDVRPNQFFRNDYSYIESENTFYKIHSSAQTWVDAKRVCAQEGATFWHPDNDNEAHAVVSFWKNTLPNIGVIHVGMSDIMAKGQFETVEGKLVSDVYNKWEPGQPNNYGGTQDCIRLYKSAIILDDCSCDLMYNFICKKSLQSLGWNFQCNVSDSDYTFNQDNGKCYKVHTTPLSWVEAYATCRREQSHLAVISNQLDLDYLVNLTESIPKPRVKENYQRGIYHVGFHNRLKEGWQTVKGTPMNVSAEIWWDSYKPADDRDMCGSMFYTGRLINTDCDMKSFFVCEHEHSNSSTEL